MHVRSLEAFQASRAGRADQILVVGARNLILGFCVSPTEFCLFQMSVPKHRALLYDAGNAFQKHLFEQFEKEQAMWA